MQCYVGRNADVFAFRDLKRAGKSLHFGGFTTWHNQGFDLKTRLHYKDKEKKSSLEQSNNSDENDDFLSRSLKKQPLQLNTFWLLWLDKAGIQISKYRLQKISVTTDPCILYKRSLPKEW